MSISSIAPALYGIIGWPLGQTLSPLIHNTAFRALGLNAAYCVWPVPPDKLELFVKAFRLLRIQGASVTIPHKIAVLPWLDRISAGAALAGAVNTLYWEDNALCGENTDIAGFLAPLADLAVQEMEILLLGAGGAAHAVCAGLKLRGCEKVRISSQSNRKQDILAKKFGFLAVPWEKRYNIGADLIINSTPLGMLGKFVDQSPYDFAQGPDCGGWAYDLVYNPVETVFLREAAGNGRQCVSGVEMFIAQASAQFRQWAGQNLPEQATWVLKERLGAG